MSSTLLHNKYVSKEQERGPVTTLLYAAQLY
jgi:hypothetical protein